MGGRKSNHLSRSALVEPEFLGLAQRSGGGPFVSEHAIGSLLALTLSPGVMKKPNAGLFGDDGEIDFCCACHHARAQPQSGRRFEAFFECYSEGIRGEPGAVTPRVEVGESYRIEVDVTCDLRQLFARRAKIRKKWTDLLAAQPGALPHPARHLVAARQEMLHSVALGANRRLHRIDATR